MKKLFIGDIIDKVGEEVELFGWVHTKRDHKKVVFIDLRDRTGIIQIVGDERFKELSPEDVVSIKGIIKERPEKLINPKIKTGKIEMEGKEFKILSKSAELPFDMNKEELDVTLPILLDHRSLTLRHPRVKDIFKVQHEIMQGFRKAAEKYGCIEIFVPTIATSATEGGAEVFTFDYYGHKAYLTQSPQLYKQMLVPVFERVFTIAQAYRAEPSVTTRHLSQSTQMDFEMGFVDFTDLLDIIEDVATTMLKYTQHTCEDIFAAYGIQKILFGKAPRLTLKEAQEVIYQEYGRDNRSEPDLAPQDEVDLCTWAREKHDSDFVIITHFPTKKRAFYTMPDPKNPEYSLSYDILFRGLEILSGSQRINDYDQLVQTIKERGMNPNNFEMYLMAFKYGMPPEGGFSFGLERLTMKVLNLQNVREASLYPRDMERVDIRLSTLEDKKDTAGK
jgi:nondiscriminating aspartyl-tRNA synthetase